MRYNIAASLSNFFSNCIYDFQPNTSNIFVLDYVYLLNLLFFLLAFVMERVFVVVFFLQELLMLIGFLILSTVFFVYERNEFCSVFFFVSKWSFYINMWMLTFFLTRKFFELTNASFIRGESYIVFTFIEKNILFIFIILSI